MRSAPVPRIVLVQLTGADSTGGQCYGRDTIFESVRMILDYIGAELAASRVMHLEKAVTVLTDSMPQREGELCHPSHGSGD